MKTITINIDKGGTGKTTVACNLADYLANTLNKKTLVIDGDRSRNTTDFFRVKGKSNIADIFLNKEVEFTKVSENLDIIEGSSIFEDDSLKLQSKQNNSMILYMWFADNFYRLKNYDYIIIDTHNDSSLATINCLAVADVIIAVSEPSTNSYKGWKKLELLMEELKSTVIDVVTRKTYIRAEHYLLANRVKVNEIESRNFLEVAEKEDRYIGMIQERAILNRTSSEGKGIFQVKEEMQKTKTPSEIAKFNAFFDNLETVFNKIIKL